MQLWIRVVTSRSESAWSALVLTHLLTLLPVVLNEGGRKQMCE